MSGRDTPPIRNCHRSRRHREAVTRYSTGNASNLSFQCTALSRRRGTIPVGPAAGEPCGLAARMTTPVTTSGSDYESDFATRKPMLPVEISGGGELAELPVCDRLWRGQETIEPHDVDGSFAVARTAIVTMVAHLEGPALDPDEGRGCAATCHWVTCEVGKRHPSMRGSKDLHQRRLAGANPS